MRFWKIKPRDQNLAETLKKIKIAREAREKIGFFSHIQRENVNKSQKIAREAREKKSFLAIYRGKTWTNSKIARETREKNRILGRIQRENVKQISKLRAKRAKKIGFLVVYRGETLKILWKNGRRRRPKILTKIKSRTYKLAEILKN